VLFAVQRGRKGFKPLKRDLFAAFFASSVSAVLNGFEGRFDFFDFIFSMVI